MSDQENLSPRGSGGIAAAGQEVPDGQPIRRQPREPLADDAALELPGSPDFDGGRKSPHSLHLGQNEPLDHFSIASGPESERRRRRNMHKVSRDQYSNEGIWLAFNKYLYTIILLFMATFHLNLLGFLYFMLFLIHTFAYYSFRTSDSPFDYLLKTPRYGKVNMRSFFCYSNIIVSSIALIFVMVLKILLHMSGQNGNAFNNDTNTVKVGHHGSDTFTVMAQLIPDFDSLYTLFGVILAFLFSLVMLLTRTLESTEDERREKLAKATAKGFQFSTLHCNDGVNDDDDVMSNLSGIQSDGNLISKRKSALKRVSQVIQDYNFKHNALLGLQLILLAMISAATLSWVNLPYQVLFLLQAFLVGFSFHKVFVGVQRVCLWTLLVLVIVETLTQYVLYMSSLSQTFSAQTKYRREVMGLLQNTTSFIVFGLKIFLIVVQASLVQFQNHLTQLEFIDEAHTLVKSICDKSFSFFAKLMAPVSQFLFCLLALIFSLMHPSVIFVPMIPLIIMAFFSDLRSPTYSLFSVTKRLFILVAMTFTFAFYLYNLIQLHKNNSVMAKWRQSKKESSSYAWEVFGLSELSTTQGSLSMRTLLPFQYEMLFMVALVTCSKYADVRSQMLQRQQHRLQKKEEQSDYDEALREEGFSSSATETANEDEKRSSRAQSENEQSFAEEDETLRGRFYRFFQVCYAGIKWTLRKVLSFATIHSTKVAMTILFLVTASEPNIINCILFTMFLLISMGNNSQMLSLWRITLGLIAGLLCGQYGLRVFASNDYLLSLKFKNRDTAMCFSGLLRCEDDPKLGVAFSNLEYINFQLYLPYCVLLIAFILGHFILTSENYQNLMESVIEKEARMREAKRFRGSGADSSVYVHTPEISLDMDPLEQSALINTQGSPNNNNEASMEEQNQRLSVGERENQADYSQADMRKLLRNSVLLCDPVTKIFIHYSLYFLIFSMALLSTTLPLAGTNVLMLILMTILVMRALQTETQIELYKNSSVLLYIIKYFALVTIAVRYASQFYIIQKTNERISDPSIIEPEKGTMYHMTALMFGFTSDVFLVRLLSLTLILLISNQQLNMIGNEVLQQVIVEGDTIKTNREKVMSMWGEIRVYTIFILYTILPVGLLGVIFLLVAKSPSLLGLIAMFATVIILQRHQSTFWMESYLTIGMFTQIFVLVTYILDYFIYFAADRFPLVLEQKNDSNYSFLINALHSNLEYFNAEQKFFTRIFWLYVILAFCFLQKRIYRYQSFFKLQVPVKPERESASVANASDGLLAQNDLQAESNLIADEETYRSQHLIWNYETCIRHCLWFKNEVALVFGFMYGVSLTMFFCLIVVFTKINITSILYMIALYFIFSVQFYPSRFRSSLEGSDYITKRDRINRALRNLITLCSVMILVEYSLITVHNFTKEQPNEKSAKLDMISSWEKFVRSHICYLEEKNVKEGQSSQCLLDWNDWLEIGRNSIKGSYFVSQYFLLMTACFAHYFTSADNEGLEGLKILTEPVHGDENDFTGRWAPFKHEMSVNSETSSQHLMQSQTVELPEQSLAEKFKFYSGKITSYLIFSAFPYIFLAVMFLSVVQFDGMRFSDLIDIGFLLQCFYLLAHIKSFYAKNVSMLSFVRTYNIVVLSILVIYQSPIFLCPTTQLSDQNVANENAGNTLYYVPAEECKSDRITRSTGVEAWHTFYVVLAQSIGLKKYTEKSAFPYAYVLIALCTEIQVAAFHHPYFQTYMMQDMKNEKLDGRMRGFMTVENFHLNRRWAYSAIKQQMRILHDRLKRITDEYNQLITDNSIWSVQDYQKIELFGESENDKLLRRQREGDDAPDKEDGADNEKDVEQLIEETMNDKRFVEMVEDIAMELLKPSLPVISIKKLKAAVKDALLERKDSFFSKDTRQVDLDDLHELVKSLISPLQRSVYFENKKKLYHTDGLGLSFALEANVQAHIAGGDAFYHNVFTKVQQQALTAVEQANAEADGEEAKSAADENVIADGNRSKRETMSLGSSNSSYNGAIGEDYILPAQSSRSKEIFGTELLQQNEHQRNALELNQDWSEAMDQLRDKEEDNDMPFMFSMYYGLKRIMLQHGTNKLIFYSLYDDEHIVKSNKRLREVPMVLLLQALFISQAEWILFGLFFVNFARSDTIINLVLPISALFYALLENPMPTYKYWRFVSIYVLIAIMMKLTIQLPVFCSSPPFGVFNCNEETIPSAILTTRIDFIIGLSKFGGPASYPTNVGILSGIMWEIVILIMLVNLKSYLIMTGQWHYVRNDSDIHSNPRFKAKLHQMTGQEKQRTIEEQQMWQHEYPSLSFWGKIKFMASKIGSDLKSFFLKLQPRYMEKVQPNRDMRKMHDAPTVVFDPNTVKPGKDYFNGNFFTLLLIFFYQLLFQKYITGQQNVDDGKTIEFDHFTVAQVFLLLILMLLMMVERMLYRMRKNSNTSWNQSVKTISQHGEWSKHALTIKMLIYAILIIYVHIWCGFILPAKQGIKLSQNRALLVNYFLWVAHFFFAALQIKHGYPQAPYKTTFMRDTSFWTVNLFRLYRGLPFIWEMKVIMDWTVTTTCLDLFQWFRLDDAFNYVYYNKYQSDQRKARREFEERHWTEKFFVGFCFAFGIILLILAPILLFSGINPTMTDNPLKSGTLELSFELSDSGNVYQIFQSQAFNIRSLNETESHLFGSLYSPRDQEFNPSQVQRVQFTPYSGQNWVISTPSLDRLISDYEQSVDGEDANVVIKSSWSFNRGLPAGKENSKGENIRRLDMKEIKPFVDLLKSEKSKERTKADIRVKDLFPKLLRAGGSAETRKLEVQSFEIDGELPKPSTSVDLSLYRQSDGTMYWTFEVVNDSTPDLSLYTDKQKSKYGNDLILIVYNESVISSVLSAVISLSVIGVYVTIVYAVGRFLRIIFDRYSERVIYEELPETQKLSEIIEGIFIAQLEGDMVNEKRLYDLLITVYRSPELMIKMTGVKQQYLMEPLQDASENAEPYSPARLSIDNGRQSQDSKKKED